MQKSSPLQAAGHPWLLTWCNVNGSREDSDKGIEGVLVEGMDLVEPIEEEEEHGSSGGH